MRQAVLFPELAEQGARVLPVVGEQKDITYHGSTAKRILNGPESTGIGCWTINPYVGCAFGCAYCYARYAHRYAMERTTGESVDAGLRRDLAEMPPWLAFERHIVVKQNAAALLRQALRHGGPRHQGLVHGEAVVIGTATDPYQPAERRFRLTRGVLEVLAEHPGLDVSIITKSPLVTRDIDVLTRIARHSEITIHISLITLDRELARRLEPRAPTPDSRVRALGRLREAGLDVRINVMPVLPWITDEPAALEALVRRVAEAGATGVAVDALRLRGTARQRYLPFIEQEFPHLAERYRRAYASDHQVSPRYRQGLRAFVRTLREKYGVAAHAYDTDDEGEEESAGGTQRPEAEAQLTLL
jgi:DNA repair photolyase